MNPDLNPCPFCGSGDVYLDQNSPFGWAVECNVCDALGSPFVGIDAPKDVANEDREAWAKQKAIEAWNRRVT